MMGRRELYSLAILLGSSLFCGTSAAGQTITIEVEIGETPTDADDYIGWTPVPARVRAVGSGVDLDVVLESSRRTPNPGGTQGEVEFAPFTAQRPTSTTFTPTASLNLTLPTGGVWKSFWVAGKLASSDGKDVQILVKQGAATLKAFPVMVRVRKNAEDLTTLEIQRFLEALAKLHDMEHSSRDSKYLKYVKIHEEAFDAIHMTNPAFPPWHRAMILSIERELQAIDPRVALPYWRYDAPAPKLFSPAFLGSTTGGGSTAAGVVVQFAVGNPIAGWKMPSESQILASSLSGPFPASVEPLVRLRNADVVAPNVDLASVTAVDDYRVMWRIMEANYHNTAHSFISGWVTTGMSPRDPLFYLLHANVDRAWADWQKSKGRFVLSGPNAPRSYAPQNSYPGPAVPTRVHQGNYAQDRLWPWNGSGGTQGTADVGDDWPNSSFPMPAATSFQGLSAQPKTIEFLDYLDVNGLGGGGNGYCYDSLRFRP